MSEDIQQRTAPTIYDHLAVILDQLGSVAWQKMGLMPDMVTGKLEPDLGQAKVAIDMVSHICSVLETQLDDDDKRQLQNLVRDLKVNYVQRQGNP